MLKRMIVLTLIMVALQVRAYEPTANNTFIDEHFIKDSVLVTVSGAVYGSVLEAICHKFILPPGQAFYCKTFAAESLALINLLRAQQPVWALATCKYLNLLLVVIASGYIGSTQFRPATIKTALASVLCYQLSRISADCTAHYLWKPDLENMKPVHIIYVVLNGVSTGLLIGGPVLWHRQNLEEGLNQLVLTLASTGTAMLSTIFYMRLIEPEEPFSILQRVAAVAIALAGAGAVIVAVTIARAGIVAEAGAEAEAAVTVAVAAAIAVIGFGFGALAEALAEAIAIAEAEAGIGAGTGAGVGVGAIAITGAIAGLLIISTTRFLLRRLSNGEQPNSISRNLAQVALISVPWLITSWLVSVNQWVMNNAPAHETMQGIYYPDTARAFFSGEWIKELYHLLWLNE